MEKKQKSDRMAKWARSSMAERFFDVEKVPRSTRGAPTKRMITIASLNIADERDIGKNLEMVHAINGGGQIDILMLQEVEHSLSGDSEVIHLLADNLGMKYAYAAEDVLKEGTPRALATLSHYPMRDSKKIQLKRFDRVFNPRGRIALAALIEFPFGQLGTFNVHLDTRINSRQRVQQLGEVFHASSGFQGPQVIAGDFNSANVFWLGHLIPVPFLERQGENLQAAMERYKFSTPFSSTGPTIKLLPLKLDWIYLKGLSAISQAVKRVPHSDHRALLVQTSVE